MPATMSDCPGPRHFGRGGANGVERSVFLSGVIESGHESGRSDERLARSRENGLLIFTRASCQAVANWCGH